MADDDKKVKNACIIERKSEKSEIEWEKKKNKAAGSYFFKQICCYINYWAS